MASTASPYGFKPVNELGGLPYAGSTRMFPIASGYAANIYNGSIVSIVAGGTVQIVTTSGDPASGATFPAGTIGIFVGCTFTNPSTKQKQFSQYWPTGTVASDALAYVVDDDRAVFQVQSAGSLAAADLGANVFLNAVQSTSTGSTTSGNSNTAVTASPITTTAAFRIVGFVDMQGFSTVGDAYTDVLVKFNPGYHSYSNAVGI
jgi:hypothetical protein